MKSSFLVLICVSLAIVVACGRQTIPDTATLSGSGTAVGSEYLLTVEPEGAKDVINAREQSKDEDDVVIVGRIGGSENPWVEGRAAFSIVDSSLKSCDQIGSDGCLKPWDFC